MRHRTQLYLDDDQYRWLTTKKREGASIAAVVRQLIDDARQAGGPVGSDPLIRFLGEEPPADGTRQTSVADLDADIYGR